MESTTQEFGSEFTKARALLEDALSGFAFADTICRDNVIKVIAAACAGQHSPQLFLYAEHAGAGKRLLAQIIEQITGRTDLVFTEIHEAAASDEHVIVVTLRSGIELVETPKPRSEWALDPLKSVNNNLAELENAAKVYASQMSTLFG